jgi:phage terminase large subunit-like protein
MAKSLFVSYGATMPTIDITMKRPHTAVQRSMIEFPGNVVAFAGRRYGKTDGFVQRIFFWMQQRPGLYWWVGLSWRSASMKRAWREVVAVARQVLKALNLKERDYINRSSYEVRIPGLGEIWFRTADNPPSLAGEGIHGVVLDEFSLMQEIVWTEYVQATLLDYGGWAAFGGVPKGPNWAATLWRMANGFDDWLQIHATSYDNPHNDKNAIDKIKEQIPEWLFNQEYMAQIVSGEGVVFRNVMACATSAWLKVPEEGRQYAAGVDVADANDYTVVSVFDVAAKREVYKDRFRRVGYEALEDRLHAVYGRFNMKSMTIEDNSIGQPVIDHLRGRGMNIISFHTSTSTKAPIIQALQSAFEHEEISILPDDVTINELSAYEAKKTASGYSYNAPSGMHDDTVMALAIAWDSISRRLPSFNDARDLGSVDDYQSPWE